MEINERNINEAVVRTLVERNEYEKLYKEACESLTFIHKRIYAIGAPLNDNCLKFNNKQLHYIHTIAQLSEGYDLGVNNE